MLYQGEGITANPTEGLARLKHAAAAGDQSSAEWLAHMFPTPESIEQSAEKKDYRPMLSYAADLLYGRNGRAQDTAKAIAYLQRLAEIGDGRAMLFLGDTFASGRGVAEDLGQAAQWLTKADAAGDQEAANDLAALAERDTPTHARDLAAMRKWAEKYLAANPSPGAYDLMARLEYFSGHKEQARGWWLKAVEGGETTNQHELGFLEWSGQAGPVDDLAGRKHLEAAAAQGNEKSMYELGRAYASGLHGLPVDLPRAVVLYQAAAEKGLANAQNNLAIAYYAGQGVPVDYALAAKWAQKAADGGSPDSPYVLAVLYRDGQGVARDPAKSAEWMQKAAELGDANAMQELAGFYQKGFGVTQNPFKAIALLQIARTQSAADQGDANAMYELANIYHDGLVLPKNTGQYSAWLQKAANHGNELAKAKIAEGHTLPAQADSGAESFCKQVVALVRMAPTDYPDHRGVVTTNEADRTFYTATPPYPDMHAAKQGINVPKNGDAAYYCATFKDEAALAYAQTAFLGFAALFSRPGNKGYEGFTADAVMRKEQDGDQHAYLFYKDIIVAKLEIPAKRDRGYLYIGLFYSKNLAADRAVLATIPAQPAGSLP